MQFPRCNRPRIWLYDGCNRLWSSVLGAAANLNKKGVRLYDTMSAPEYPMPVR